MKSLKTLLVEYFVFVLLPLSSLIVQGLDFDAGMQDTEEVLNFWRSPEIHRGHEKIEKLVSSENGFALMMIVSEESNETLLYLYVETSVTMT